MLEKGLLETLKTSKYTVALSGQGMVVESGYPAFRDDDASYEIEEKYGYAVDELYSSAIYNTRIELFYKFYREELLSKIDIKPGKAFEYLAKMEQAGLVNSIITRRVFGLSERAGCKNVINLHGTVYDNECPHCKEKYPIEFILDSKKTVPICPKCNTAIRPGVCLLGEMVDNAVMTEAAEEVEKADVLLVLGSALNSPLCSKLLQYYEGNKLILITPEKHFADDKADMVIYSTIEDGLKPFI